MLRKVRRPDMNSLNIPDLQRKAAMNAAAQQQQVVLLASMTAVIAGPLLAVDYARALRKLDEEEGVIPGQTDGQFQLDLSKPLTLARHAATMILKGPQGNPNGG